MRLILALALALVASLAWAHGDDSHAAGEPGDGRPAARAVEIFATDAGGDMRFTPDRVTVAKGEMIRFTIRNQGAVTHEFVLGTKAENAAHAKMMAEMPEMQHADENAVTVPAGGSAKLIWRFTRAGEFEFACLIPGHYEAGMHGVVTVK